MSELGPLLFIFGNYLCFVSMCTVHTECLVNGSILADVFFFIL